MSSYDNVGNKIAARYQQKIGNTHLKRKDITFCDHTDLGDGTARVLVSWDVLRGEPTVSDVESFIWASFEGKMMPKMDTARIYDKDHAIEVLVEKMKDTLPLDAAKERKMAVVIPGKTYVDKDRTTWEVREAEDGTKYLVRKTEEDIDSILQERRKYASAGATLPKFRKLHAGYATAQPGDTVEFYHGAQRIQGKINSMGKDNKVSISAGGTTFSVDRQAITRIVQHSEAYLNARKKMQKDYYQKYLGPELAEKIVNLGPDIEGVG